RSMTLSAERLAAAAQRARGLEGDVELGDVLLPSPPQGPKKVQGRVVNAAGEGVPGTPLYWVDVDPAEESPRYRNDVRPGSSGASGAFEIDEIELGPETTILAQPGGNYLHEPVPFHQLRRDDDGGLLIELQEGLVIAGRVLLDELVPADGVGVSAWPLDRGPAPERAHIAGWIKGLVDTGGAFRIEGLRPGAYCVRAGVGDGSEGAVLSSPIELRGVAGETATLSTDLDLRGRLGVFGSRVANAEGYRLDASVSMSAPRQAGGKVVYGFPERLESLWRRGQRIVYAKRPGALLVIQCDGYFPVAVEPENAPAVVVLERGFEIDLEVTSEADLGGCPGHLRVELLPLNREESLPRQVQRALDIRSPAQGVLDDRRRVRIAVPGAGAYRVQLSIDYQTRPGYGIGRTLRPAEALTLQVSPSGESVLSYGLAVPAATYEQALAVVRERFDEEIRAGVIPPTLRFGATHER
ncbi:MAG: hypothetical protein AAGG01_22120, partial [Planctomycetota bacterium]